MYLLVINSANVLSDNSHTLWWIGYFPPYCIPPIHAHPLYLFLLSDKPLTSLILTSAYEDKININLENDIVL